VTPVRVVPGLDLGRDLARPAGTRPIIETLKALSLVSIQPALQHLRVHAEKSLQVVACPHETRSAEDVVSRSGRPSADTDGWLCLQVQSYSEEFPHR